MASHLFQLLGPVEASYDGGVLSLGGARARAVLAALLCYPNIPVDPDRLIRLVWGEGEVARDSLYHYIAGLRAALRPVSDQVYLKGLRPNYQISVDKPEQVIDWHAFVALVGQAGEARRAGDPAVAMTLLREAVGLWRGRALDGVGDALAELRAAMTARRLSAAEDLAELELAHGEPGRVPDLLVELCQQHPDRERAAALLIRGLGAVGRREEAIAVYRRTRQHILDSLGLDPHGPLEQAYRTVVDHPISTAVQQALRAGLPGLAGHFIGRDSELGQLTTFLTTESEQPQVVVICAVEGMAGTGKTELAKHAAFQHAGHFPDGIVFLDLLGYTPDAQPMEPAVALGRLLRRLGVPGEQIPTDLQERATIYRSKLADKRMLIVLDNARTSTQVQPLLPAAPGCRVIITSRQRLIALDDAHPLCLDILDPADAYTLFTRLAGITPTPQEATTLTEVVTVCGRLPLAIRILAARYRTHAWASLAELHTQLADQHKRLAAMDDGQRSITTAFAVSYRTLPADQQRMFRLLGLLLGPEPDTDDTAAAALAATTLTAAQRLLTQLADASLLTRPAPGRYGFHDLLRVYATDRGQQEEPPADQQAALSRLLEHYTHTAYRAAALAYPHERDHLPRIPAPATPQRDFTTPTEAVTWLEAERSNLLAAAEYATTHQWPAHASDLSQTLARHLHTRAHHTTALSLHTHALHATSRAGDRTGEGRALAHLGNTHRMVGRYDQAAEHLQQALDIARDVGDRAGEGRAWAGLGEVYLLIDRYDQAISYLQQALTIAHDIGDRDGQRYALAVLGEVHRMLGRYDHAAEHLQQALAIALAIGDRGGQRYALAILGEVHLMVGHYDQAAEHLRQALDIARDIGDRGGERHALAFLGVVHRMLGRYEQAAEHLRQALDIARDIGDRNGQRCALTGLGTLYLTTGRYQQALDHHQQALTIACEIGDRGGEGYALVGLGQDHRMLGHHDQACEHLHQALVIFLNVGDRNGEFEARNGLGDTLRANGYPDQALTHHRHAATIAVEIGQHHDHARALTAIAHDHHDLGDPHQARPHWQQALQIFIRLGTPEADQVRAQLAALDPPDS